MAGTMGPREHFGHTGLAQVLAAYAARGGHLMGARRRLDSPLTLTHVRWVGGDGMAIDAARALDDESLLSPEERETWVQLALDCPVPQGPMAASTAETWFSLGTAPARAAELVRLLHVSRSSAWAASQASSPISGTPLGPGYQPSAGLASFPDYGSYPMGASGTYAPRMGQFAPSSMPIGPRSTGAPSPTNAPYGAGLPPLDEDTALIDTPTGWTSAWQTSAWQPTAEAPEVTVLACVEIEMPQVLAGPAGADYMRDFSRDVAISFKRICRAIPQVRETRGWMRGNYLVLAARMVVGSGNRPPSSLETETAAQMLAEALARQTLPYNRLALANPGEWAQGVALPN